MIEFTLWDIARNLMLAARWTVLLSLIAFAGGGLTGLVLLAMRVSPLPWLRKLVVLYVELFQGTPLLMQLFLGFFGLPMLGIEVSPWAAATVTLTLYTGAYLADIWRGCIQAMPKPQWEASECLSLSRWQTLRLVIIPQAMRLALPPTVGFLVQLIKMTSLASVIGFIELTRAGQIINNSIFQPFLIFGLVGAFYFVLCYPLSRWSQSMENKLNVSNR